MPDNPLNMPVPADEPAPHGTIHAVPNPAWHEFPPIGATNQDGAPPWETEPLNPAGTIFDPAGVVGNMPIHHGHAIPVTIHANDGFINAGDFAVTGVAAAETLYKIKYFESRGKKMKKPQEESGLALVKYAEEYPKDQKQTTTPDKRVCVVSGHRHAKSVDADWMWYPPYWVHKSNKEIFGGYYVSCGKTNKWCHTSLTGSIWNHCRVSLAYLKENGYILLDDRFCGYWEHPSKCFEYYTGVDKWAKPHLAPKPAEKHYMKCPVTGRKYHRDEFRAISTIDGVVEMSNQAVKPDRTIHQCHYCSDYYKEPLIEMFQDAPGNDPRFTCVKCKNKILEKNVIRHYDDSEFLPPIPDKTKAVLRGQPIIRTEQRLYGLEIEVGFNQGVRAEVAVDVWNTLGKDFCYIKHDGSITKLKFDDGYVVKNPMKMGFEIVTAPAGINVQRERWKALANAKNFKILRAWDADSCGLHVHVNRASLTWLQIGRILVFMNHVNNRYFVEVVAGRSSNYYTRYLVKNLTDCGVVDESKYMAVRTNKKHTIEFRIFRSTVNYRHIIRDIEFTEAVCDFCAPCANSFQDMTDFRMFIKFVERHKTSYPMLSEWLQGIDLIAKKPLPKPEHHKVLDLDEALSEAVKEQLAAVLKANAAHKHPLKKVLAGAIKKVRKADGLDPELEPEQDTEF